MKKILMVIIWGFFTICVADLFAQGPDTLWTRSYGGENFDCGHSVQQTSDGGYIIGGYTHSFGCGSLDIYLIKTDALGDTLWTKTYGGTEWEDTFSVQQTSDGGYIIAGYTFSFGPATPDGANIYLIKTDVIGDTLWTKIYGGGLASWGAIDDYAYSVQQTSDGGYVIAGTTDKDGYGHAFDVYLIKIDALGDTLWTKAYGGSNGDWGHSLQQTSDGGYIIAGMTQSFNTGGGDDRDVYLIKTDALGDTLWTKNYGGTKWDEAFSVQQTSDGGYIMAGYTRSFGAGDDDIYVIKTDAIGDTLWTRVYGEASFDNGRSVQQTFDGGYIVTGWSSLGADYTDFCLIKIDASGNTLWIENYGGPGSDEAYSVQQTSDGGYIIAGITGSYIGPGYGGVYLVKTKPDPGVGIEDNNSLALIVFNLFQNYPNPFNHETIIKFTTGDSNKYTEITIYNFHGQKIKTLVDKKLEEGSHEVVWDGTDNSRNPVSSGIYFYKMNNGRYHGIKKMIMLK